VAIVMAMGLAALPATPSSAGAAVTGTPTTPTRPGTATVPIPPSAGPVPGHAVGLPTPSIPVSDCPWLAEAMAAGDPPAELAQLTETRMTLEEKLGELILRTSGDYENVDSGVARLCIPSLTLSDGPWGLAFGDTGVTELPDPLAVGATFSASTALQYGDLIGSEAAGQGIDVSQGPNLNIDRVPTSGRADESYGEDPLLTTVLGTADIEGLQARGVMADAKHLAVYNQETNRGALDDEVPTRALQELYLPPFKAAVTQAHVATLMCAYPRLDGTFQCEDPALGLLLGEWGFDGFVRSDLGAVHDEPGALSSGVELLKPGSRDELGKALFDRRLSLATLDDDVERVLTEMFAYGVVGRAATGTPGTPVDPARHAQFALTTAEQSAVLLKNASGLLPISARHVGSVAVIGADASTHPVTEGFGSSHVVAPFVSTPLAGIATALAGKATVRYADGGSTTQHLPTVPTADLTLPRGHGHGLLLDVGPLSGSGGSITTVDPLAAAALEPEPRPPGTERDQVHSNPPGQRPRRPEGDDSDARRLTDLDPTTRSATSLQLPAGWSGSKASWSGRLTVPHSGLYTFSLSGTGAAALTLDGRLAVSDLVPHDAGTWSGTIALRAGHHYRLSLDWVPVADAVTLDIPSILDLGMAYVGGAISRAVALARSSSVAVVFAADYTAETFDRPNLVLPGDENDLISAVATANPDTVVVLNTGGPVVMPWLDRVGAVVEDWYPGEEDGAAIAAVLTGAVDPSGHLPVTFPTSLAKSAISKPSQWPGVDLTSTYSEGLLVGYRYDHATGTKPLFPFGFGLSYTTFSFHHLTVSHTVTGSTVSVRVENTGHRAGTDVVQAYLTFPKAAHEPPGELAAFSPVTLAAGTSRTVTLTVPASQLATYQTGGWTTVPGTYTIGVGDNSASQPTHAVLTVVH
jgi:beta-glucosidase